MTGIKIIAEADKVAGSITFVDTAGRREAGATPIYARLAAQVGVASRFWQEISIDRATDNLIEIDLRVVESGQLPDVWQWGEKTEKTCVPRESAAISAGVKAVFTAADLGKTIVIKKQSDNVDELFFNWLTGKGYVRIRVADTIKCSNQLHELVWDFRLLDGAGALVAKAKGTLFIEPAAI